MSMKYVKFISLFLAIFLMAFSMGACKKNDVSSDKNTKIKTNSANSVSTTKKKSTSNTKKSASKESTSVNKSQTKDNKENNFTENSDFNLTSEEEITSLIENALDKDKIDLIPIEQDIDLGGATIKIVYDTSANWNPGQKPSDQAIANYPKAAVQYNTIENAKKKMNFNIKWVYRNHDYMIYEYMDACAAGTKYADILLTSPSRIFPTVALKKLLIPMDNFIDFENDPLYNYGYMASSTKFLGRNWGFTTSLYGIGYVFFYNKDIFQNEGLPPLEDVYKEGNWTWDTMVEFAKKATHDSNGDGVTDQWGVLLSPLDTATYALLRSNNGSIIQYDERENTYKFKPDINAQHALQLVYDLVNVYKVTTPSSSVKFDRFPAAMVVGKGTDSIQVYQIRGINYGMVPMPKGPDVSETQFSGGSTNAYFIPLNTDPKVAAAVIKEAFTYWDPNKPEYLTKEDMLRGQMELLLPPGSDINSAIKSFEAPKESFSLGFGGFVRKFKDKVILKIGWENRTPSDLLQEYASELQEDLNLELQPQ